ncbi:MAG: hypothetical protein GPJ54_14815 [Candidatus Heimdallarchaeota archaeon]|nr:hypothetical protein [Candidatus Heimdallarchaeota archaeon]
MTKTVSKLQPLQYLCTECNETRNLSVNATVHLNRRELKINGLASYIDIHSDTTGRNKHGAELVIDGNFHVRGFSIMKVKEPEKKSLIPSPVKKKTEQLIISSWSSWNDLILDLKTKGIIFKLSTEEKIAGLGEKKIIITSELQTVCCEIQIPLNPASVGIIENIKEWITIFINFIESASSLWKRNIPDLLHFIDRNSYRRINQVDVAFLKTMLDDSAIIRPHSATIRNFKRYVGMLEFQNLSNDILKIIVDYLHNYEEVALISVINELNAMIKNDIQEDFNGMEYYYQLFLHDSIDYFLSNLEPA